MNKKHPYDDYRRQTGDYSENKSGLADLLDEEILSPSAPGINYDLGEEGADEQLTVAPRHTLTDEEIEAVARERQEAEEIKLRALAEVDNMRKRMAREKEESIRFAAGKVLGDILPALDNLDLALEHAQNQEACKDFFVGVDMTRKLLLESLKKHGLAQVGEVGEVFDPTIHEAMGMAPHPVVENGAVCQILNKGYKLHERLLRPARVIVCKK